MSAASNYTENNIINTLYRCQAFPAPSRVYVALHTANPGDDGNSEVSTTAWPAYQRRDPADGAAPDTGWIAPTDGTSTNAKQILYPSNNGVAAVTVTHWSVWDAAAGGNMLSHASLNSPRTLLPSDVFVFDVGALTVQAL